MFLSGTRNWVNEGYHTWSVCSVLRERKKNKTAKRRPPDGTGGGDPSCAVCRVLGDCRAGWSGERAATAPGLTGGGQAGWGLPGSLGIALFKGFLWKLESDLCQEQPSGNN